MRAVNFTLAGGVTGVMWLRDVGRDTARHSAAWRGATRLADDYLSVSLDALLLADDLRVTHIGCRPH